MSERLEARGEVLKLARVLSVDEPELEFLRELPPADLREFREQVTNRMFDSSSKLLTRIGAATKLVPSGVVATVAQRAFGPLLSARAAGAVDTGKAIDVVRRLPPVFLSDAAVEVDPRRVASIIGAVPKDVVVPVAAELGRRKEYVTMGRFLAFVPDDAIVAAMEVLDDEALLRTAFVLEHKERLDHAIGLLPSERLPGILLRAGELGLWPEALDLLDHLSDARRGPIADIVAEQDEPVIAGIVEAVAEARIWESLLPVVGVMSDPARVRLAAVPAFHQPAVMGDILKAAAANDLWTDLVPLIDAVPDEARGPVANIVAEQDDAIIAAIVDAVAAADLWENLLPIARSMSDPARRRLAAASPFHSTDVMEQVVRAAATQDLWVELVPLIEALPDDARRKLPGIASQLEQPLLQRVLRDAANAPSTLPILLGIVREMDDSGLANVIAAVDAADRRDGEHLLSGLANPGEAASWLQQMQPEFQAAVARAATRLGMKEILDKALAQAGPG
jgi:hypothetical protein